ncbi:uncharacterized protein LOC122815322 isoform X2 [Protopterus annectens]|uniref:uncharacterized protein LOC122815322 isoform X2 n=1 Tax=Protopterus annectens TaxID=7888 RepID=UPI001CF94186|nr:uncharacterized protein LOC122815322 isoform X2 [Protopterus annectens]
MAFGVTCVLLANCLFSGINSERSSNKQYQWQLKKNEWMNIEHDSIIETHYSLPWAKSIKLFNTPYGKLFIDFNKMEIRNKRLQVRRQSFETSESENVWCWYYYRSKQWTEYGKKDLQGKRIPVQSAAIERKYQKNKKGAFRFEARHSSYKISFQEMIQTNTKTGSKRKVRRRPKLLATPVQSLSTMFAHFHVAPLSTATTPRSAVWQFEGNTGKWYNFKHRSGTNTECSISNSDIEIKYQGNPASTLAFTVGGFQYKLDFSAMQQTNLTTGTTRRIRRVES